MIPAEDTPDVFSRRWDISQSPIAWPTWLAQSIISEIDENQRLWELRMLISINNYCWFTLILIDFTCFTFQCTSIFCHQDPPRFIAFGNSTSCCKSRQGSPWDFRASHCKSLQNYTRIPPAKNLVSHRESLQHSQQDSAHFWLSRILVPVMNPIKISTQIRNGSIKIFPLKMPVFLVAKYEPRVLSFVTFS